MIFSDQSLGKVFEEKLIIDSTDSKELQKDTENLIRFDTSCSDSAQQMMSYHIAKFNSVLKILLPNEISLMVNLF